MKAAARRHCGAAQPQGSDGLDRLDQLVDGGLAVAIEHARVVQVEQRVLDAGEARALATLDDDDVLRLVGVEGGDAIADADADANNSLGDEGFQDDEFKEVTAWFNLEGEGISVAANFC